MSEKHSRVCVCACVCVCVCVCVCNMFCILNLPVGHLGGFHVLAIVNNNAVNMVGS